MSSLFGILGTMADSIMAQQAGIDVTGQNVANVNTPGYVRRTVDLGTQPGTADQGGVVVLGMARSFDSFAFDQVIGQTGLKGAADGRSGALSGAQNVLAPMGGGDIGTVLSAFFTSLSTLSASPSDPSARAAVLSQATNLAQTISQTAQGLQTQRQALLTQAQGTGTELSRSLAQIAQLNGQIAAAKAGGTEPSDLEDQQEALVTTVAQDIGGQVLHQSDGSVTLVVGGSALVSGTSAEGLSVGTDSTGKMQITATSSSGAAVDITAGVTQGTLGGLREARDTDLAASAASLDQFAYDLASSINAVHASGYGLDGVTGRALFTPPSQVAGAAGSFSVDPSVAGNPAAIAASSSAGGLPGNNDVAVSLAQLADQPLGSGGTPAQTFGAITAQLGGAAAQANSDSSTRASTLAQARSLNSSASGVSLAEENVNLTQFQQAFQASSQVLQTVDGLLNALMQIVH